VTENVLYVAYALLIDTAQAIGASVLTMGLVAMWRRRRVTRVAS